MATMLHPVMTPADPSAMSLMDIAFFTDGADAQRTAYRDFQRARQIEQRDVEIGEYLAVHRDRLLAKFFTEQAAAIALNDEIDALDFQPEPN